ncbi:glycine--tRNA ligase subunit beta [Candidatus Pelagibacter sp.]|uniref:glycine--tRNA ligase subunit beta n=1 Tax=Candidatus Pelagibacter sp. TaxID=2024849 RepID=UPI003F867C36
MSEFFLELFSEEIPSNLQKKLRDDLLENFQKSFNEKSIEFKNSFSKSTPNRAVIVFEGLKKETIIKSEEIKGPNIKAPEKATEGFLRSNNITKKDLIIKKTDKGDFYFFKKKQQKIKTQNILKDLILENLNRIQWKKSMRWGHGELNWGRPLKSILAIYDKKKIDFKFHHIQSNNYTFLDAQFEERTKIVKDYKDYQSSLKKIEKIVDNDEREKIIEKQFDKIENKKNFLIDRNRKVLDEVINLTDQPNCIICKFDERFLKIPKEILIITMQHHQKYFPTHNIKGDLTNEFIVVSNKLDKKGLIKLGNERVVEARLTDAEFFWNKDKSLNLVKQVSKLKAMNYFEGLGTYYDKAQRMRKLGSMISDELLISKEKVELSASISKVDLISEIVGEFPELQGLMGGYFAEAQGFEKDISIAISEQYLPIGLDSKISKKPYSIALSISDKLDNLVGFFGIDKKPTSSKDPFALRRIALGLVRTIIENKKDFKIKDLIRYSASLYETQNLKLTNQNLFNDLEDFLIDRFKYYMREKNIRHDIIEASIENINLNTPTIEFDKAKTLNKLITNQSGKDVISIYKRASNIIESENRKKIKLDNTTDPGIFKSDFERNLLNKINDIRKYFSSIDNSENYEESLSILASAKEPLDAFFDNVQVNDKDENIKKNRLELLQMFCKTFENFTNFSKLETTK